MKLLRTMFLGLCLLGRAGLLVAGTSSENNATVDTTAGSGSITITMHRATGAVLENTASGTEIDEPLRVRATNRALLGAQPVLQGSHLGIITGGLVADGVTPLLFRISANAPTAAGRTYELKLARPLFSGNGYAGSLSGLLLVEGNNAFVPGNTVTLSTARPEAYVVVQPVRPEDLQPDGNGLVRLSLQVRDTANLFFPIKAEYAFAISRPPVALVHGYNVADKNWGTSFTATLAADRAPGFVIPVGYGIDQKFNLTGSLWELAAMLHTELGEQIETSSVLSNWAWTRYDAVGHSQGGVLLRMLCSELDLTGPGGATVEDLGFSPWRASANHHRGRFRRVVTIGSPHAGSTLCEMGFQLRIEKDVDYGVGRANFVGVSGYLDGLLQKKFRVGNGTDLVQINATLTCDADARLHLLGSRIYDGNAPGVTAENNPVVYEALYLNESTPTVFTQRPGLVVAPDGSDGVVELRSQTLFGGSNHASTQTGEDIAHAAGVQRPAQTDSVSIAQSVRDLLNGTASEFGSVTIPPSLVTFMEARRFEIDLLAEAIENGQTASPNACYAAAPPPPADNAPLPPSGDQTLYFILQPPAGESPDGPVGWNTTIYGPDGVEPPALTQVTTGTHGVQLALTIPATLQGQVVLSVRFPSTSGKTVIGTPQVVFERLPGTALTGIALDPATVSGQVGAELPLLVLGIYDGSVSMPIFTSPTNTVFQSSNTAVATVDGEGRVKLFAHGTATITANYAGTLIATAPVTVLDVLPIVVNPPTIPATVGQALTFQLSASQVVQAFAMDALPAGLTLDALSGLIEGVPATEGRFPAVVTVQNANGTGSKQMEFVIAGVPGAPTDVGVDASGVNGGKPVGTVVGRLVTVDPNPLDTFTYQLVSGAGGADNGLFTIAGDTLVTAAVLDGAATSTVSIRVRTTDSSGASFEKALVLPVGAPPTIVRQPDAREVFAGESAIFFVETTGLEPLQYQWKKEGVDVAGATSRIFELPAAALADAGIYSVAVSNGDGSVTSAAASLVVDPISYGKWASALPSGMASALFEPGADYNADGIVNFLDFAFGVQPGLESGGGAQPAVSRDALGYLLTYREANGIAPLTVRILKSVNLGAWVEHVPGVGEVTRTNLGTHTVVAVRVPAPNPGVFLKVEVSGP